MPAPKLIPILSHRYQPGEPHLAGNPGSSVYQTDSIHDGDDLADYLAHEFQVTPPELLPDHSLLCPDGAARSRRPVRFWDVFALHFEMPRSILGGRVSTGRSATHSGGR